MGNEAAQGFASRRCSRQAHFSRKDEVFSPGEARAAPQCRRLKWLKMTAFPRKRGNADISRKCPALEAAQAAKDNGFAAAPHHGRRHRSGGKQRLHGLEIGEFGAVNLQQVIARPQPQRRSR
jgi:hypothetical protein